jgi:hypothetical protein
LSKAELKKLKRKHSLPARLLVTATDSDGRTLTTSANVTLKLAVKHRHHHPQHAAFLALPRLAL